MDRARPAKAGGGGAAQGESANDTAWVPSKQTGFARVEAERADAATAIGRTLKVWRSVAEGGAKQEEDAKSAEGKEEKKGEEDEKDEKEAEGEEAAGGPGAGEKKKDGEKKDAAQAAADGGDQKKEPAEQAPPVAAKKIYRAGEDDFGDVDVSGIGLPAEPDKVEVDEAALTASTPVNDENIWKINFNVAVPSGGQVELGEAHCNKQNGAPNANGPQMHIDNKKMVNGKMSKIKLKDGKSLTTRCLKLIEEAWRTTFNVELGATQGKLAKQNLLNFQMEFAKIKQENQQKGLDESDQAIGNKAIRKISFGESRIELGYTKIDVTIGAMGPASGFPGMDVPLFVTVVARK